MTETKHTPGPKQIGVVIGYNEDEVPLAASAFGPGAGETLVAAVRFCSRDGLTPAVFEHGDPRLSAEMDRFRDAAIAKATGDDA